MPTSIGERLRRARQAQNLSLEDIAGRTHIHPRYLQAMEAGNFAALVSRAQRRGFLRLYAEALGLDADVLLSDLEGVLTPEAAAPSARPAPESAPALEERPAPEAAGIYREIGAQLRERRAMLSLSPEEVERRIHIRSRYLEAMETGRFDTLPSPVQARGMLKIYAEFLSLNADALLLRFAEALQSTLAEKRAGALPAAPREERVRPSRWRFLPDWMAVILVGGLLSAFLIWTLGQVASERAVQTPAPTPPEIADVLLSSPTPAPTFTPSPAPTEAGGTPPADAPAQQQATPTPVLLLPTGSTGLNVNIVVHQRAWMKVVADGKTLFSGRVAPGGAYPFSAEKRIEITTGNAAALQVYFLGRDLGVLGLTGDAAMRIFTRNGVATPTPRITSTPSPTVTGTPSPAPTLTPTP